MDTALKKVFAGEGNPLNQEGIRHPRALFINRGRVVSNETLLEHVWDSNADLFSNALRVHIASIRKKLPGDIIKNVRGQGYYVE